MKNFLSFVMVGALLSAPNVMLNVRAEGGGDDSAVYSELRNCYSSTKGISVYVISKEELLEKAAENGENVTDTRPIFVIKDYRWEEDYTIKFRASEDELANVMNLIDREGIDFIDGEQDAWSDESEPELTESEEEGFGFSIGRNDSNGKADLARSLCVDLVDACRKDEKKILNNIIDPDEENSWEVCKAVRNFIKMLKTECMNILQK